MIECILYDAIRYAKRFYGDRTSNKIYPDLSVLPESKQAMYKKDQVLERMKRHRITRPEFFNISSNEQKIKYLQDNEHNELVGNCVELSWAVYLYLIQKRAKDIWDLYNINWSYDSSKLTYPIYIQLIATLGVYDHVFLLLDHSDSIVHRPKIGTKYNELPEGTWVCDPWADIVCLAENYNDKWKNKMMEWNHQGMCLMLKKTPESPSSESFSPLKKYTFNTIQCSTKQVYRLSAIHNNGEVENII
ncbi:hypothetical protein [Xenorhabdus bharatensis]|uniref:hypothetical protein n=1 Tax=Xenorhabdus bharatensis TaxID=3136256 RepID=UPI0030F3816A